MDALEAAVPDEALECAPLAEANEPPDDDAWLPDDPPDAPLDAEAPSEPEVAEECVLPVVEAAVVDAAEVAPGFAQTSPTQENPLAQSELVVHA